MEKKSVLYEKDIYFKFVLSFFPLLVKVSGQSKHGSFRDNWSEVDFLMMTSKELFITLWPP